MNLVNMNNLPFVYTCVIYLIKHIENIYSFKETNLYTIVEFN